MTQLSFFDAPPPIMAAPANGGSRSGPGITPKPDLNYRIMGDEAIGWGGQMGKVRQNLAIITLLKQLKEEKRQATPAEQKQLVLWTGWGHTAQPFHPKPKGKWADLQAEMRPLFSDEEWEAASVSTINAHYTSPEVIAWQWAIIQQFGFTGGRVLEPALGAGHYFGLMPLEMRNKSQLFGCELDLISAAVSKQLYPGATIYTCAFESAPYESGFFDLAITNVPFANVPVFDPTIYHNGRGHLADIGLHNYYFVKALELLRAGGLLSFITSRFTMDSLESKVRAYLDSAAYFLGAVRLPVMAFKKNAHTEVTTDIIFLMKRDQPNSVQGEWVETVNKGDYRLNAYYERYPHMMLGEMRAEGGRYEDAYECVAPKDITLGGMLDRILEGADLPNAIYKPAPPKPRRQFMPDPETFENPPGHAWLRPGSYAMDDYYRIWQKTKTAWGRAELDGRQLQRVRGLIEIRDAFHRTIQANTNFDSDEALTDAQRELGIVYRRFVAKWGYLHEPANRAAFGEDVDSDNILSLERWDPFERKAEKAAIFTQRLLEREIRPEKADTPLDALIIALRETGQVYMPRMIELTGLDEEQLAEALKGQIYHDPDPGVWVTADEYLSGNIRFKLARAEHVARIEKEESYQDKSRYEENVLALREVLPKDVGPKDIFAQLGAPWVPKDIYQSFIMERLFDDYMQALGVIKPIYLRTLGYWKLDTSNAGRLLTSAENQRIWGTSRITGVELIEKCMNGQQATIYDTWEDERGKEHRTVNQEDTLVARAKQQEIKAAFVKWVWLKDERAERLVRIYNERFNSTLPRKYDGTALHFPGMNPKIILRQIQKDVVWRGLQQQALMIAHAVGFGKTYSLTGLTMRLKQTKLRQRVMIVVKRATYRQFLDSFREAYPLAKISTIASGQSQTHRRRQLARIVTEDYDVILTTHPVYYQIPLKPSTKAKYMRDQLAMIEEALVEASDTISTKELQKAKKRMEAKLRRAMEKGSHHDENALYFEDLGIDALLVDESGAYKNLWFPSVMSRISGVGGSESGRAYDMFLKIRWLQAQGGFIAFASGTPLENSISEVWVMMNYLMPHRLEEMGLHFFDAWAATFGEVVTAVEMKPDGSGFRMASRFAAFNNLAQLKRLWREVADTRMSAEDAGIERPEIATGKAIGIQAEPYPELKQIIRTLANRANRLGNVDPSVDNILKIMSDADKASLDARLLGEFDIYDEMGKLTGETIKVTWDYPGSKVNLCADQVAKIYHDTSGAELPNKPGWYNLTQLVFLDSSTPKAGEWTVYEDFKQKLIARGVKPHEIAFAQDYSDDDKKAKLAAAINAGKIRVCVGHTEIMGIGLNCQRLLVALHHLDCPWKPAWIEQREGRINRQGNLCPMISIYRYVMAGSFDVYRWQTVERKYSFIVAFNSDDMTTNSVEDPGMAVLSAREMTTLATGNRSIIRQVELQTELRILSAQKREYEEAQYHRRGRLKRLESERDGYRIKLQQRQVLLDRVQAEGIEPAVRLGEQLYEICMAQGDTKGEYTRIGELYGLEVLFRSEEIVEKAKPKKVDRNFWGAAEETPLEGEDVAKEPPPPPEPKYERKVYLYGNEQKYHADFELRISQENRIKANVAELKYLFETDLPAAVRERQRELESCEVNIVETERILAIPFEYSDKVAELESELAEVEREIRETYGEPDAAENRQAARVELLEGQEIDLSELFDPEEDLDVPDEEM